LLYEAQKFTTNLPIYIIKAKHMVNGVDANPPSVGEGDNHMVNGGDVVPQSDGHGHTVNESELYLPLLHSATLVVAC
jgi:hypothetical protein